MRTSQHVRFYLIMFLQLFAAAAGVPLTTLLMATPDQGGLGLDSFGMTAATLMLPVGGIAAHPLLQAIGRTTRPRSWPLALLEGVSGLALILVAAMDPSPASRLSNWGLLLLCVVLAAYGAASAAAFSMVCDLILHHLEPSRPSSGFLPIRGAGTLGFVAGCVLIGFGCTPTSRWPFIGAGLIFLVLMILSLAILPTTGIPVILEATPARSSRRDTAILVRECNVGLLLLVGLVAANSKFYEVLANPYLVQAGFARPTAVQSLAQAFEVVSLVWLLPSRAGSLQCRAMTVAGPLGWTVLYGCFVLAAYLGSAWALVGLPFQATNCLFITGCVIDLNARVDPARRLAAQGLLATTQNAGLLAGTGLVGVCTGITSQNGPPAWGPLWTIALACSALNVVFLPLMVPGSRVVPPTRADGEVAGSSRP